MALTQSIQEFIAEDHDSVILAISSAVIKGKLVLKDGVNRRVGLDDCVCYAGGQEIRLSKLTLRTDDIIGWGTPD